MKLIRGVLGISLLFLTTFLYAREADIRILFVGNSLTYTNNLPQWVKKFAKAKKITISTEILAFPNYALEDHWNEGKLQTLIRSGNFDFVIVQQGPSSQVDGKKILVEYGSRIQELCSNLKTKLVFFMVWPAKSNFTMFEGVIRNYSHAAEINGAILCPVGSVWKEYIERTKDFSYYGPDGFHPSLAGTKVAASIIVNALFP